MSAQIACRPNWSLMALVEMKGGWGVILTYRMSAFGGKADMPFCTAYVRL